MAMGNTDGSIIINTKVDQSGFNAGRRNIETGLSGLKTSLKKFALALGMAFSVAQIISFGKASVQATTDFKNALTGLQSVLDGLGKSYAEASDFITAYTADGLMSVTQAATAYKNLALRGYDDSQIQAVMTALKDSAAFGRQSSYTLGEAVQSASEGLKNENSILVNLISPTERRLSVA